MSTPASQINICKGVRLDNTYRNTIYFSGISAQLSYFLGKVVKTFTGYTYLRKSWSIKVSATMEQANSWTYLFFSNGEGQKTWYYFINNIEYVNDNTVELFLELDVMQTYMFDYTLLPSFVEREHAATDTIGANIVDEGLDVGELVTIASEEIDLNDWRLMMLATSNPVTTSEGGESVTTYGHSYDGIFSGLEVYCVYKASFSSFATVLNKLDGVGATDSIISMWMYPGELISTGTTTGCVHAVSGSKSFTDDFSRNSVLENGYVPRNNKLFCYPYNFLYVTDNNGGAAPYPYEFFGDPSSCTFKVTGSVSADGGVRMYPLNFKGCQNNFEEGLTLANYPSCAWDSDTYKLWLAQNQNQQKLGFAMAGAKILGGIVTAAATGGAGIVAGGGAALSGAADIAHMLAQRADKDIQPPQAKGQFSACLNMAAGFQTFTVKKKCITEKQARILDAYFDMYGYKTMAVKVPNRNARASWTYTKTCGCNISGNLCKEDAAKICAVYDSGVTFWRDGDNIGRYDLDNFDSNG